jgi:hypothetical protein
MAPAVTASSGFNPGSGSRPANAFNNNVFLILFALIAAAMVVAALWFFFVARSGGFHWRETDWDDYKSTVLRRKGPDGRTLTNATRSTKLGGGSVVPKWAEGSEVSGTTASSATNLGPDGAPAPDAAARRGAREDRARGGADADYHAYRHERTAKVGGYNKPHEGSHYDYSTTNGGSSAAPSSPSGAANPAKESRRERRDRERAQKSARRDAERTARLQPSPRHAPEMAQQQQQQPVSPAQTASSPSVGPSTRASASYQNAYRPADGRATLRAVQEDGTASSVSSVSEGGGRRSGSHHQQQQSRRASGSHAQQQQQQQGRRVRYEDEAAPASGGGSGSSAYTGVSGETGTKSYPCHIPGLTKLSEVGVDESISQVGAREPPPRRFGGAFRRG